MEHNPESCKDVFELLSQYFDMELPADACQEIESHLAGCPPCVEFADSLRRTVELCRQYDAGVMPEPLTQSARDELKAAWEKMLAARAATR
ncbi:MAG TPA: zf-HC2 domain-containing protein [Bryobacteraceae bacterium]|nr:zf-HC2 domain-containing protein [Bryobacteraceae bacterium]